MIVSPINATLDDLSPKERYVAYLLAQGYTNRQIAEDMHLSIRTAENHVSNIISKTQLQNRATVGLWYVSLTNPRN